MACPVMARCAQKSATGEYDSSDCHNPASMGINMKARSLSVCTGRKRHDTLDHGLA
jgi:hypothetical protein